MNLVMVGFFIFSGEPYKIIMAILSEIKRSAENKEIGQNKMIKVKSIFTIACARNCDSCSFKCDICQED